MTDVERAQREMSLREVVERSGSGRAARELEAMSTILCTEME